MGWVKRENQTFTLSQIIHQRKFVIFQESQKTGGKNGLKMAVYRGTYFEWVAKAEEKRR